MNEAFALYGTKNDEKPTPEQIVSSSFEPPFVLGAGTVKQGEGGVKAPQLVCKDGKSFYVTNDREKWEELYAAGEVVFSEQELLRLKAACDGCTAEAAKALRDKVLLVKETFTYAYIRRGAAV